MFHSLPRRAAPVVVALLLLAVPFSRGAAQGADALALRAIASSYAGDETNSLVELDYQFDASKLIDRPDVASGERLVHARFRLHLVPQGSGAPLALEWRVNVVREAETPQIVVGVKAFDAAPGLYHSTLELIDEGAGGGASSPPVATFAFTTTVIRFNRAKPTLSDLEIAEEIRQDPEDSGPYAKYGFVVVPSVMGIFTAAQPQINTYVELYNAARAQSRQLLVLFRLNRVRDKETVGTVAERSQIVDRPDSGTLIITNAFGLDSMTPGDYRVVAILYDGIPPNAVDSSLVGRGVYIAGEGGEEMSQPDLSTVAVDPLFAGKKEMELNDEWSMVIYIATPLEKKLWEGLSGVDAKGRFLSRFWQVRDDSPETSANEVREDYMKRVDEARKRYASPNVKRGWESDRGRVLLQYGRPLEMDRHPQDFNIRPYEIWTYNRFQFVFLDRTQHGDYMLVHSDAPNERSHTDWLRDLGRLNKEWEESSP